MWVIHTKFPEGRTEKDRSNSHYEDGNNRTGWFIGCGELKAMVVQNNYYCLEQMSRRKENPRYFGWSLREHLLSPLDLEYLPSLPFRINPPGPIT